MFGKFVRRRTSEMYAAEMMERKQIRRVNRAKAQKQQQERKKLLLMILMTILIVLELVWIWHPVYRTGARAGFCT